MARAIGIFGAAIPVPADAPLQDRLLGLTGREPQNVAQLDVLSKRPLTEPATRQLAGGFCSDAGICLLQLACVRVEG
jgi:hypothetical protein